MALASRGMAPSAGMVLLIGLTLAAGCAEGPQTTVRRAQIVDASILGAHAWQAELHRKSGKGDDAAFGAPGVTDAQLDALVRHHKALLSDPDAVAKWVAGEASSFDPSKSVGPLLECGLKLDKRLPVKAADKVFADRATMFHPSPSPLEGAGGARGRTEETSPALRARALANLLQIVLETDRDGGVLQQQLALYKAVGLLTDPKDFGVSNNDQVFLNLGTTLANMSCEAPFGTSRGSWRIALRKIQNWVMKHRGIGPTEYADELLKRRDIEPLMAKMKDMPAQKILVIGHSFTLKMHWSTLSPFNQIVETAFEQVNPAVKFAHLGHGGMSAASALRYLDEAVAMKPSQALIVVVVRGDADGAAMEEMTKKLTAVGAKVATFDQLHTDRASWVNPEATKLDDAVKAGLNVIGVSEIMAAHPDRSSFICLDGVHMTDPYHKMMADLWLKWLVEGKIILKPEPVKTEGD